MAAFQALHQLSMFAAVAIIVGGQALRAAAIWRRDVRALAVFHRLTGGPTLSTIGTGFLAAGIVFGLLAALTGGWSLLDGWLLAAYVLVAMLVWVDQSRFAKRLLELGAEALEAEAGTRPAEDVMRGMAESDAMLIVAVEIALFAALISDMAIKPF